MKEEQYGPKTGPDQHRDGMTNNTKEMVSGEGVVGNTHTNTHTQQAKRKKKTLLVRPRQRVSRRVRFDQNNIFTVTKRE